MLSRRASYPAAVRRILHEEGAGEPHPRDARLAKHGHLHIFALHAKEGEGQEAACSDADDEPPEREQRPAAQTKALGVSEKVDGGEARNSKLQRGGASKRGPWRGSGRQQGQACSAQKEGVL